MVILDYPYISQEMCARLAERRTPVLRNPASEACALNFDLHLLDEKSFVAALRDGAKLYLNSENALDWVMKNDPDSDRIRGIGLMKDKHALRETLRPMYPGYQFSQHRFEQLGDINAATLRFPLVLKPSVGFFSVGVFVIHNQDEWDRAVKVLAEKWPIWKDSFPAGVVGDLFFSIEDYIVGDEYAVDAYYDESGKAVVLNVMHHKFADAADVRDRLYCTYTDAMPSWAEEFAVYLNQAGEYLKLRNFPFHMELRVTDDSQSNRIIPIEFNPLRFAGCCTTDLARHAYGVSTWLSFLDGDKPDWNEISRRNANQCFSLIMLDKPENGHDGMEFNYDEFSKRLTEMLETRAFGPESSAFGYVFARTPGDKLDELDAVLHSDLTEFLRPAAKEASARR